VSIVASFNDQWVEQVSVEKFLAAPDLPKTAGATDCNGAIRKAVDLLSTGPGAKEIWLFGDGQGLSIEPGELARQGLPLNAHIAPSDLSSSIRALCRATGGEAFELEVTP
jgi:hypothetical protein